MGKVNDPRQCDIGFGEVTSIHLKCQGPSNCLSKKRETFVENMALGFIKQAQRSNNDITIALKKNTKSISAPELYYANESMKLERFLNIYNFVKTK